MSAFDDLVRLAASDPAAACARMIVVADQCTPADLGRMGTLCVHLHARLNRLRDGIAMLRRLMELPAAAEPGMRRSLERASVALLRLAGERAAADNLVGSSCVEPGDRPRLDALTAHAAVLAGRWSDVAAWLDQAAVRCAALSTDDPTREAIVVITRTISHQAQLHLNGLAQAVHAAAALHEAAATEPAQRHQALHHRGLAHVVTGRPDRAVEIVESLLEYEHEHGLTIAAQVATAALAVRAQTHRGMPRLASAARSAATTLASQAPPDQRKAVDGLLADLDRLMTADTATRAVPGAQASGVPARPG